MIRLASAHAKARLSTKIELQDAETAVELVQFAYFKKVRTSNSYQRNVQTKLSDCVMEVEC